MARLKVRMPKMEWAKLTLLTGSTHFQFKSARITMKEIIERTTTNIMNGR